MRTPTKPEPSGSGAPAIDQADETEASKHDCWSGEYCSSRRFSLRGLFRRRSWNCAEGKTSSTTTVV